MLDWIREHHEILSLLANIGMLVVWIAYLQLFLANFRRQTRSKILINIGAGRSLEARCLVGNMSSNAIYVESLIATLETTEGRWQCPVTDVRELTKDQKRSDAGQLTRQGPLMPGSVMDIGSFRDLVGRAARGTGFTIEGDEEVPDSLTALELQVIADFGPDDLLVGAKRRFELDKRDGYWSVGQHTPQTEQIRSRRERRRIKEMLGEVEP